MLDPNRKEDGKASKVSKRVQEQEAPILFSRCGWAQNKSRGKLKKPAPTVRISPTEMPES